MANIGYPDTKNKKQSGFSLGSPFFKKDDKKKGNEDQHDYVRSPDAGNAPKKEHKIQGPKDTYTNAYKNRDKKRYGDMSPEEYTAESKRQTAHYKKTGKWDYKGEHKTEPKTQSTDPTTITSENVSVKSNKEKRKERQAQRKKDRANKRITKLQNKAAKKGSLTKAQQKRLARNEQKSRGEEVSDENRTKAGKVISKVGSKIKSKIQETKARIAEKKKKKEEEKKKKKNSPLTSTPELKGKRWKKRSIGDGKIYKKNN